MSDEQQVQRGVTGDGAAYPGYPPVVLIEALPAELKRVTTTSKGTVQVTLESETLSTAYIEKVQGLVSMQQEPMMVTFEVARTAGNA